MPYCRGSRERGAAAVEFALILPVFLLLIAGAIDLTRMMYTQVVVTNAAREGARMAALGYPLTGVASATARVDQAAFNAKPVTASYVFYNGPSIVVSCPSTPGPTAYAEATVTTTNFQWLMLGNIVTLFGGSSTPPQLSAKASMRCSG